MGWCGRVDGRQDTCFTPAVSDTHSVHLLPSNVSKPHDLQLVDVVDFGGSDTHVITVDCMLDVFCMVMGLETLNDTLVHWLDVCCEIWFKILHLDVLKTAGDDMT